MEHGELKVIPFNPESPHPMLTPDEKAIALLIERGADNPVCWTLRQEAPVQNVAMEFVSKKAYFRTHTRTCPVHGEVTVVNRNYWPKSVYTLEGLSCGHLLTVSRLVGALKSIGADTRLYKSWIHRGWLYTFKQIYDRHGK